MHRRTLAAPRGRYGVLGEQQLGGLDAFERRSAVDECDVGQRHPPRREIEPCDAGALAVLHPCGERRVALRVEQAGVGQRARGDDPRDPALDEPLACRRIADLVDDHGTFAPRDESREMLLDCVVRHARHGNRRTRRLPPGGQRDVEELRSTLGVGVEQLVEITHPVEEQPIGMLVLEPQVLLHHRRVLLGVHRRFPACANYRACSAARMVSSVIVPGVPSASCTTAASRFAASSGDSASRRLAPRESRGASGAGVIASVA